MAYNEKELQGLFKRVLNEKKSASEKDEADLVRYMNEVFKDGYNASNHEIHQFNNLVVREADLITRQRATELLTVLADVEYVPNRTAYQYTLPRKFKATAVWAADGTSVQRQRVEGQPTRTAVPKRIQGGFYYEPETLVNGDIDRFRDLVNGIVDAKLRLYWKSISNLANQAVTAGNIPGPNVLSGSNLTLADYRKLAGVLARYGGRPVFVSDTILIDHFAQQQQTNPAYRPSASNDRLEALFNEYNIGTIGITNTAALVNPFIEGSKNTMTELAVNEGFMFAGDVNEKPFKVIEFGPTVQETQYHYEIEQVELKFYQYVAIEFVQGDAVGYIKDDSVTLN